MQALEELFTLVAMGRETDIHQQTDGTDNVGWLHTEDKEDNSSQDTR